jgi:ATP/ADP translocase
MKHIMNLFVIWVLVSFIIYLLGAFMHANFDISQWPIADRGVTMFIMIFMSVVASAIYLLSELD